MVASVLTRSEANQAALQSNLNQKHYRELVRKRGLNPDWVAVNCKSVDKDTAAEHLGYSAHSDGILLTGAGYQEQFKPDKPWPSGDGKRPKYRSCRDEDGYDAMLPRHPEDPHFWNDIEALKAKCYQIDGKPCLGLTEGFFKSISLTSHGVPTIALLGVEMGLTSGGKDPENKRFLVETLRRFAEAGFGFIIGFDADCTRNKNVLKAQEKLGDQLSLFDVKVYSITGLWYEAEGKGIDDYIQGNGYEKFRDEVLSKAEKLEDWKKKHLDALERQVNQGAQTKPPTPRETSKEIAEDYQDWKYDNENKTWRHWTGKYWEAIDDGVFRSTIKTDIDGRGINYAKADYISNVVSLITDDLRIPKWKTLDRYKYIAFDNGVLEVATRKLRDHNPDDGLTYVLPHKYQPIVVNQVEDALRSNCPHTYQYLVSSQQKNWAMIKKMLAVINGVVTGKLSRLQMFVHLSGKPRSGKGTFTRLLKECVGVQNHTAAPLSNFSKQETCARLIDKMLVECPEQRKTSERDIGSLLAFTGRDSIECKRLYRDSFSETFNGAIVLTSNRPVGTTKYRELEERLCLIPFLQEIPKQNRLENLDELIQSEISQLLAIALGMSDPEVVDLLRGQGEGENPVVKLHQWESTTDDSTIAAFFNDKLIVEAGTKEETRTLYKVFESYCDDEGKRFLAKNKFSRELNDLCTHLGLKVNWNKTASYPRFEGLRLRKPSDDHPTYVQVLSEKVSSQTNERPSEWSLESKIETIESLTQKAIETKESKIEETSSFSSKFKNSHEQNQVSDRSSQPENPPSLEYPKPRFAVGDKVKVINRSASKKWFGRVVTITEVEQGTKGAVYSIELNGRTSVLMPEAFLSKPPLKPALVKDVAPRAKEDWLYNNRGANKLVWFELDGYEREAQYLGLSKDYKRYRVNIDGLVKEVTSDCIQILESQAGKIQRQVNPPEGDQIELSLDNPPQTEVSADAESPSKSVKSETIKQRFKRLAKQVGINLKSDNLQVELLLERFGKSAIKDLTDDELIKIADKWKEQIANREKFERESSFMNRLNP